MNKKEKDRIIEYLESKGKPVRVSSLCLDLGLNEKDFVINKPFRVKTDFVPGIYSESIMLVVYLRHSVVIDGNSYPSIPFAAARLDKTIKWVWEKMDR